MTQFLPLVYSSAETSFFSTSRLWAKLNQSVYLSHSNLPLCLFSSIQAEYLRFYFKVLDEVPEDNCRFLEESGLKIYMAGMVRFYHIEVSIIGTHLMAQIFLWLFSSESCPTPLCSPLRREFPCSSTGAQVNSGERTLPSFFKSLGPNDSLKPVTNYISIAPAKERLNDILFIGGQKVGSCRRWLLISHWHIV